MIAKILILLCALSAALAYPHELVTSDGAYAALQDMPAYAYYALPAEEAPLRFKRQLDVQARGSRRHGFDINANARVPVWKSDNGRHSIDGTAGYSQHLGGPYGNSRPDLRGGASYTFRF